MLNDFYRDKRVFITGHTGFKGSWLAIWLARLGAKVFGYSLSPDTVPDNYTASGVASVMSGSTEGDLRDRKLMEKSLFDADPDVVFHLAAQSLVRRSYDMPHETVEMNVMGTVSLLEAIRKRNKSCAVVIITSDKCYFNREQTWGYRECDPMGGYDPYSASKGATEIICASWRHSFFNPDRLADHGVALATARAGNVIGGGDWAKDRIVPDIVRAINNNETIHLRNPNAVRPWQHVLEPLSGYLLLAARLFEKNGANLAEAWNFGPGGEETMTVREFTELFISLWGKGAWEDNSDRTLSHEAKILRLCIDKAIHELKWKPRWNIKKALVQTVDWYKNFNQTPGAMYDRCLNDITEYDHALFPGPQ